MSDRFDLEQQILACWNIVEDLELLRESMGREKSKDDLDNFVLSLKTIYEAKFEKLFGTFEKMIEEKKFVV